MAEIVAGAAISAIGYIVLKLGEILNNEVDLLLGVRDGIETLKTELNWMRSFLKDAENKLDNSNLIREWVSEVRDLAYEAEDVIDTFLLKFQLETHACSCCFPCRRSAHKLGSQLDNLIEKAKGISSRRERYGLNAYVSNTSDRSKYEEKLKELRTSSAYATNEHMIGLSDTISRLLDKSTSEGSGLFVMSILGMGGLGKTTVARSLYNILKHEDFHSHGWICVSQEYDTKAILLDLIKSMTNSNEEVLKGLITKGSMEAHLRNHLNGHSFLVVIDDVWDQHAWESIQKAFPEDEYNKSRVIITTRVRQVAEVKGAYVEKLRYLNEEESWELFCRKCFQYYPGMKCPQNLEELGKEMIKKCSGLPLAIVTLGGLLSLKSFGTSEWKEVKENLWKELNMDTIHINAVLALSYKDLSYNLKQCFLYIGMLPEDLEISISKLMLLWEAEDFIGQEEEYSPEDIAKSYFNELVDRGLLQKTYDWYRPTCRIHDLLRDLAIRKAKDIGFSANYDGRQKFNLVKTLPHRRLRISYLNPTIMPVEYTNCSLRTFHLKTGSYYDGQSPYTSDIHVNNLLQSLHKRFSLLRVLDIWVVQGEMLSLEVGNMIHLRYLEIHCRPGVKLSENIGNLKALQTISIFSNKISLPKTMVKLQNLKHMAMYGDNWANVIGKLTWIGKLICLESLTIQPKKWCEIDTTSLINLHRLSILGPYNDTQDVNSSRFYLNFESLIRLHTLYLRSQDSSISISDIFKRCPSITHLKTITQFDCPDFHEIALNLEVLEVYVDNGNFLLMPSIQRLPKLRALNIILVIPSPPPMLVIDCSEGGFAQLRTLHIGFYNIVDNNTQMELKVAEGGMPLLTNVHVNIPGKLIAPDRLKITVAS
ncbi:unnamed protein product [Rhodiola kirilowii]